MQVLPHRLGAGGPRLTPQAVGRCRREGGTVVKNRQQWVRLGLLVLLIIAGVMGCQAGPRPQGSILDGCASPTPSNKDWCLSTQFPNII